MGEPSMKRHLVVSHPERLVARGPVSPFLYIEHVTVRYDAIDITVLTPKELRVTSLAAQYMLRMLPSLDGHICISGSHERFGEEIVGTEVAHLLEHVTIELIVQTAVRYDKSCHATSSILSEERKASLVDALPVRTFTGHTSHLPSLPEDDPATEAFRVSVTYDNDLVAIAAIRHASTIVLWALGADFDVVDVEEPPLSRFEGMLKELLELHRC